MLDIKIKKLNKNVQLPKQGTQGAAGMDFYLPQPVRFEPNRSKKSTARRSCGNSRGVCNAAHSTQQHMENTAQNAE